jgi:hypothetical protein
MKMKMLFPKRKGSTFPVFLMNVYAEQGREMRVLVDLEQELRSKIAIYESKQNSAISTPSYGTDTCRRGRSRRRRGTRSSATCVE